MKKIIILLVLAAPGFIMAQESEDQIWEKARYEISANGASLFYTDINLTNHEEHYSEEMLERVKTNMLNKEGIVKVEFLHFNQTIRAYHFDYVDLQTVKSFVLDERQDIEVMNRVAFRI